MKFTRMLILLAVAAAFSATTVSSFADTSVPGSTKVAQTKKKKKKKKSKKGKKEAPPADAAPAAPAQ